MVSTMLNIVPNPQSPAKTRNVILKQCGPTQEELCCFAASASYTWPARKPENRKAAAGFPSCMKLKMMPKCLKPKSSDAVGIIMPNWTPKQNPSNAVPE